MKHSDVGIQCEGELEIQFLTLHDGLSLRQHGFQPWDMQRIRKCKACGARALLTDAQHRQEMTERLSKRNIAAGVTMEKELIAKASGYSADHVATRVGREFLPGDVSEAFREGALWAAEECAKVCDASEREAIGNAGGYWAQEDHYAIETARECARNIRAKFGGKV